MLKKNEIIEIEITAMSSDGNGIGKQGDFVVFVPYTVVGDTVKALIVKVNKSFCFGKILELVKQSESRIEPKCELFTKCGGCAFMQMTYKQELEQKQNFVSYSLERIGGITQKASQIIGSPKEEEYRNKVQFPFKTIDNNVSFGFFAPRSHRIVPIKKGCILQPGIINDIALFCAEFFDQNNILCYDETNGNGVVRHVLLRKSDYNGEIMVCLVINKEKFAFSELFAKNLVEKFPSVSTVVLNINRQNTNVIMGERCETIFGKGFITDILSGVETRISPLSFFQINNGSATLLYQQVKRLAGLDGNQTVLDLFCGAGTIGLSLVDQAKYLYGAEIVPQAIADAKQNAKAMGAKNAEFFEGDAGEVANMIKQKNIEIDVVITDPPRKGCDENTIEAIVSINPKKIIMVSCNAATLARDLKLLCEKGYQVDEIVPVDMFPRTTHVETVAALSKLNVDHYIEVEIKMEEL